MNKLAQRMVSINQHQNRAEAMLYIQKHGLHAAHSWLSVKNEAAKLPYHSTDHCLTVTKWCGRLASMENLKVLSSEKGLILGAMFHDFNHTGGKAPDSTNIQLALDVLEQFAEIHIPLETFNELDYTVARDCIIVTQFPFEYEPDTYEQEIIRDADILQSIDIDYENILGEQLRKEIEVSRGHKVTRKQFAEGELAFLDTIKMYTKAGEFLWASCKPLIVQRFQEIAKGVK